MVINLVQVPTNSIIIFSSGDPISVNLWYPESLKDALSVGTFKSNTIFVPCIFDNFHD